jgi:hypothetical protein
MIWHTKCGGQDVWTWDVVSNRSVNDPRDESNPQLYRLEAGFHTLTIEQSEDGVKLDTIIITNDLNLGAPDLDAAFQPPVIDVDTEDQLISEFGTAVISFNATDPRKREPELPMGAS